MTIFTFSIRYAESRRLTRKSCRTNARQARTAAGGPNSQPRAGAGSPYGTGVIANAYCFRGDYAACVEAARRSFDDFPAHLSPKRTLAVGLAQVGRAAEAVAQRRDLIRGRFGAGRCCDPRTPALLAARGPRAPVGGLRKAGWRGLRTSFAGRGCFGSLAAF